MNDEERRWTLHKIEHERREVDKYQGLSLKLKLWYALILIFLLCMLSSENSYYRYHSEIHETITYARTFFLITATIFNVYFLKNEYARRARVNILTNEIEEEEEAADMTKKEEEKAKTLTIKFSLLAFLYYLVLSVVLFVR